MWKTIVSPHPREISNRVRADTVDDEPIKADGIFRGLDEKGNIDVRARGEPPEKRTDAKRPEDLGYA